MITLTNDFHNTSVRLRANIGDYLSPSQIKRAARILCPVSDCCCGHTELNTRMSCGEAILFGRQDGFDIEFGRIVGRASKPRNTWTTAELQDDFEVEGFGGGLCVVRRRSDNQRGSLQFDHMPRLYFNFVPA